VIRMDKCVWVDGGVTKACRVLRARLAPLGYRVVCKTSYADEILDILAKTSGCTVVSTDKRSNSFGWIYIDNKWIEHKSARDIATRIIKLIFSRSKYFLTR